MEQLKIDLWQAGYIDCIKGKGKCNLRPCTAAQEVMCCKDCKYKCSSKCKKVAEDEEG